MKWHELGDTGTHYVHDLLGRGGPLAKEVKTLRDVLSGHVSALLPDGLVLKPRANLRHAMDWASEYEAIRALVIEKMARHLAQPGAWLAFEDRHSKAPDVPLAAPSSFFVGEEVYYFAVGNSRNETIEAILSHASPWWTRGFLGAGDAGKGLHPGNVQREVVSGLALEVQAALVGAFDEEGYVWWTPEHLDEASQPG